MQLTGKRSLRLICGSCEDHSGSALDQVGFHDKIDRLERSLREYHESCVVSLRADFSSAIKILTEEITILKESNIQLLHFLNPTVVQPEPSGSHKPLLPPTESNNPLVVEAGRLSKKKLSAGDGSHVGNSSAQNPKRSYSSAVGSNAAQVQCGIGRAASQSVTSVQSGSRGGNMGSRQQRHGPYITGARTSQASSSISAVQLVKRASVAVSRLSLDVTDRDLEMYLKSTFGSDEDFTIEKMTVRSSNYSCFRVEARFELLEALLDPLNWIEGVRVKKFRFFRFFHSGPPGARRPSTSQSTQ